METSQEGKRDVKIVKTQKSNVSCIIYNIKLYKQLDRLSVIQIRIDPPYPLVCRKKQLNGGGLSDETEKKRGPVSKQVWHVKDPSLLKGPERRA
jgi:hypothetical protein